MRGISLHPHSGESGLFGLLDLVSDGKYSEITSFHPHYVFLCLQSQELPARVHHQPGVINGSHLKTSVYKHVGGERVAGNGSEENHKMLKILEKRVY